MTGREDGGGGGWRWGWMGGEGEEGRAKAGPPALQRGLTLDGPVAN